MDRTRSCSWSDPQRLAEVVKETDGAEFLKKIGSGDLPAPPVAETTCITMAEIGDGYARFELTPAEWHHNPIGSVHGGILSTLADTALGCAVHSTLPAGTGYTSLDLTIKFTRPATLASGTLTCEGRVVTSGRRTATAEGRITDGSGRVIAHAVTTCLLFG
ncbi:PaaI family thioesterase [Lentzea guizhouensis]|uniref:PaaI family thioesterase n=1 Tax=Lentzea guizhouensis TaxID=1586287 RepID=UPI0009F51594|nr:PaaI family thioesterase [Lentzea guizhouensis]